MLHRCGFRSINISWRGGCAAGRRAGERWCLAVARVALLSLALACNGLTGADDIDLDGCEPAETRFCVGANGCDGTRTCDASGTWSEQCVCSAVGMLGAAGATSSTASNGASSNPAAESPGSGVRDLAGGSMSDDASGMAQCSSGTHACGGQCVSSSSVASCGSSCTPCPSPPGGTATCDGRACGVSCANNTILVEGECLPGIADMSTGIGYACAALSDGTVRCWGTNEFGQLGNGTQDTSFVPLPVPNLRDVVEIDAGFHHVCARLRDGTVRCWGANEVGQLGNGTLASSTVPVPVLGVTDAVRLGVGFEHSCVVTVAGQLRCWGDNDLVAFDVDAGDVAIPTPVTVSTEASPVLQLGVGGTFICASLQGGSVQCWGALDGVVNGSPSQVSGGFTSACMIGAVGRVECLGYLEVRDDDELGALTTTPTPVAGLGGVTALALGSDHNCALTAGRVQCWGENVDGQLGNGTVVNSATPVTVVDLEGVEAIWSGATASHTCARVSDGSVHCWGFNGSAAGGLGVGSTETFSSRPLPLLPW
jgi:hypothetical protein